MYQNLIPTPIFLKMLLRLHRIQNMYDKYLNTDLIPKHIISYYNQM
jgi:hypothetical protein